MTAQPGDHSAAQGQAGNACPCGPALHPAVPQVAGRPKGELIAVTCALLAVLAWAGTPAMTKIAVSDLEPVSVALLRGLLAAALALPLMVRAGRAKPVDAKRARAPLLVAAITGMVVFPLLFSLGVERTSAGHAALLLAFAPVFTALIGALWEKRAPHPLFWLGMAVAAAGSVVLVGGKHDLAGDFDTLAGDLLVLVSVLAAALGYIAGARAAEVRGSWSTTLWANVAAGLLWLLAAPFVLEGRALMALGTTGWLAIAYLALVSSLLAYGAWYWALAYRRELSQVQFLQPLFGLALAMLLLSEPAGAGTWLAALLIVLGVAITQRRRRWTRPAGR